MIGYFEDEAVNSYTEYLELVKNGSVKNINAPSIAIDYYGLKSNAKLSDLIKSVRADEMHHSDVNHSYADNLDKKDQRSKNLKAVENINNNKVA